MPELPEIANLMRSLEPILPGATVTAVDLRRRDIVRSDDGRSRRPRGTVPAKCLLLGETIEQLARHGKELAIIAASGRSLCIHLGMSGQLRYCPPRQRLASRRHVHCIWRLESNGTHGRLVFRDPRRFGGLWSFESYDELRAVRWSPLGPDALSIDARTLRRRLHATRRAVKAALLDQRIIAGIGNIYADEALFAAGVHPASPANAIPADFGRALAAAIRRILARATADGGSTVRDYADGRGRPGTYARRHVVYGRASESCSRCGRPLDTSVVAQRTTVFCPRCQRLF